MDEPSRRQQVCGRRDIADLSTSLERVIQIVIEICDSEKCLAAALVRRCLDVMERAVGHASQVRPLNETHESIPTRIMHFYMPRDFPISFAHFRKVHKQVAKRQ